MQDKLKIGFDAKRAFFNRSGLGNYSRDTIRILSLLHPENDYFLYSPKKPDGSNFISSDNIKLRIPEGFINSSFPSLWRSSGIVRDLKSDGIQIFHGLSNEIPLKLKKSGINSVVTIHDLIFLTHPQYYKFIDRNIYRKKFTYSASHSDAIITVSRKTKEDVVNLLNINQDKVFVVYQGCNPIFNKAVTSEVKTEIRKKYGLPSEYLLCVGTIEERKNQLALVKAVHEGRIDIPIVMVGRHTSYYSEIEKYIRVENLKNVIFLQNISTVDLPAIYQMATVFVYPSLAEGFGIPVVEALASKVPVITSEGGSMEEAGGAGAQYINPENIDELIYAIHSCVQDSNLRNRLISGGTAHSLQFTDLAIAENLMRVYHKVI